MKLTPDGAVKVLDFGLAKAMDPPAGSTSAADLARSPTLMNSPTMTDAHRTQVGVIPSSEGARYPFWSPDGRSLEFFNTEQLLRVDTAEGAPLALAPANDARGGSWSTNGTIVYAPSYDTHLLKISSRGGPSAPASVLDGERSEGTHRFPSFLPDGRHFLFEARGYSALMRASDGVFVGSLDEPGKRVQLLPHATNTTCAAGRLLFVRNGDLGAQRFDPDRRTLSGPASILVRDGRFDRRYSLGVFSAAAEVLALQHGAGQDANELVWLDRTGRSGERLGSAAVHEGVELSPDATQVLVSIFGPATSRAHLEVFDLTRKTSTRLTFGEADDYGAIWSADGTQVLFACFTDQGIGLWVKPSDGSTAERLFRPETRGEVLFPVGWSPDGSRVLLGSSPGGRCPRDSGPFRCPERAHPSASPTPAAGGSSPRTRPPTADGREGGEEIVYLAADAAQATALPVDLSEKAPRFGVPERLFLVPMLSINGSPFDVSPDGERFLFVLPVPNARPTPYTLILNWERLLEQER